MFSLLRLMDQTYGMDSDKFGKIRLESVGEYDKFLRKDSCAKGVDCGPHISWGF